MVGEKEARKKAFFRNDILMLLICKYYPNLIIFDYMSKSLVKMVEC